MGKWVECKKTVLLSTKGRWFESCLKSYCQKYIFNVNILITDQLFYYLFNKKVCLSFTDDYQNECYGFYCDWIKITVKYVICVCIFIDMWYNKIYSINTCVEKNTTLLINTDLRIRIHAQSDLQTYNKPDVLSPAPSALRTRWLI